MNKIYIAGKITGDPDYQYKFEAAAYELADARRRCSPQHRCKGCIFYNRDYVTTCRISSVFPNQLEIVNPATFDVNGKVYWRTMFYCVRKLLKCEYIFMLNDWQQSRGARIEHRIAKLFHKQIIYQK